jgi:hypothetical protein
MRSPAIPSADGMITEFCGHARDQYAIDDLLS